MNRLEALSLGEKAIGHVVRFEDQPGEIVEGTIIKTNINKAECYLVEWHDGFRSSSIKKLSPCIVEII